MAPKNRKTKRKQSEKNNSAKSGRSPQPKSNVDSPAKSVKSVKNTVRKDKTPINQSLVSSFITSTPRRGSVRLISKEIGNLMNLNTTFIKSKSESVPNLYGGEVLQESVKTNSLSDLPKELDKAFEESLKSPASMRLRTTMDSQSSVLELSEACSTITNHDTTRMSACSVSGTTTTTTVSQANASLPSLTTSTASNTLHNTTCELTTQTQAVRIGAYPQVGVNAPASYHPSMMPMFTEIKGRMWDADIARMQQNYQTMLHQTTPSKPHQPLNTFTATNYQTSLGLAHRQDTPYPAVPISSTMVQPIISNPTDGTPRDLSSISAADAFQMFQTLNTNVESMRAEMTNIQVRHKAQSDAVETLKYLQAEDRDVIVSMHRELVANHRQLKTLSKTVVRLEEQIQTQ